MSLHKLRENDQKEWERLYLLTDRRLIRLVTGILVGYQHLTTSDVGDIVSETYIRARRGCQSIDTSYSSISPWLNQIARSVVNDFLKSSIRREKHTGGTSNPHQTNDNTAIKRRELSAESRAAFDEAVFKLSPKEKAVYNNITDPDGEKVPVDPDERNRFNVTKSRVKKKLADALGVELKSRSSKRGKK